MVGVKQIILVFLFLQPLLSQEEEDCDPVFEDCEDTNDQECDDPVFCEEYDDYNQNGNEECDEVKEEI